MKKIAIMTWWNHANYGTALQVTAMSKVIEKLGYEVKVINYIPHGKVVTQECLKSVFKYIIERIKIIFNIMYVNHERNKLFNLFLNKNLKFTRYCETSSDLFFLSSEFDGIVCGSDQIWSPSNFNSKYFLDFVEDNKKIAYAPSIGCSYISDENIANEMSGLIGKFKHLSIRETKGAEIIKKLCNKVANVVLDPTLLLNKEEWLELLELNKSNNYKDDYIFCYFLGDNKKYWDCVKKISKKMNLSIKIVPMHKKDISFGDSVEKCDPRDFIDLINNAKFICTDSFHGIAFAINFNKEFIAFKRFSDNSEKSQNSRIYNILNLFGLEDRLLEDVKFIPNLTSKINYKFINDILDSEREKSKQFLSDALNDVCNEKSKQYIEKVTNSCCGCGVCQIKCPTKAIAVEMNDYGFYSCNVDISKCIKCGLCRKVCPFYGYKGERINQNNDLYAVKSNNSDTLRTSSSGGIAHEIASFFLDSNFDIFGCSYNSDIHKAEHIIITKNNKKELEKLSGSKYIQSDLRNILPIILKSTKGVFFGTPCQVSAIDKMLKENHRRKDFILVDLICHGIPSYNMFYKYLEYVKDKAQLEHIDNVIFRYKNKGWRKKYIFIKDIKKSKFYISEQNDDLFYKFFRLGHCYMESCFECNYRNTSSADLRIGDYWGDKYRNDRTGVSMVVALNEKGSKVIKTLEDNNKVEVIRNDLIDYFKCQDCRNPIKPVFYNELQNELADDSIKLDEVAIKYCHKYFIWKSRLWEIKDFVKRILKLS